MNISEKKQKQIIELYNQYVREILTIRDMKRWATKKSVSESVLFPTRTNEKRIRDALAGVDISQGDKVYLYYRNDDTLNIADKWNPALPDHSTDRLFEKLFKTVLVFKTVFDLKECLNYSLKKNKKLLPAV